MVFTPETLQRAYKLIAGLLLINYGVFMVGYFFMPDYNLQYKYFIRPLHILVLPGIVILAAAFKEIKSHPIFQLIILYMLYLLASSMWSTPFELYKFGQKLANAVYILSFIVLTHFLRTWYKNGFDRMLRFSMLFAAVSAIITLLVFYNDNHSTYERVQGLGSLSNVNEFSNVYAVYALLAMSYGLKAPLLREKIFYYCQVAAIISFIWFGQSRMAFVSLSVALLVLVISGDRRDKVKFSVLVLSTVGLLVAAFPELLELAWTRGAGPRPLIWQSYLNEEPQPEYR